VAIRCDEVRLDGPKRTPQGGLKAAAYLTRSGVFTYHRADGSVVREYRPEDEVFKADSLGSLASAPVTRLHPSRPVDAKTFRKVAVGYVGETVSRDGDKVAATVYVQDSDAVEAVEKGLRQVSCGYRCDIDETPGVTADGQAYDRVQRNVFYNHVALVPVGRAGAEVALRLDAADNLVFEEPMQTTETKNDAADKMVEALTKATERADAAEKQVAALKQELAEMPAKLAARAALEAKAVKLCGAEFKADGLSDEQIKDAMVDAAIKASDKPAEVKADAKPVVVAKVEQKSDGINRDARAEMIARHANAWKQESK
jgi:hypothetical protein